MCKLHSEYVAKREFANLFSSIYTLTVQFCQFHCTVSRVFRAQMNRYAI